ncbi:trichohyalin isoform X2 [Periophthalmus magnuspinnatus]|uniref:trichohyalin isoform X2 n=1 Tax=Periophthalmus magnuspinnatus TaxID=409849 RepID=UPI0024372D3E|nr:trichohyalin isoform X2 [Periophthalmus magnuspinnatus]
MSGCFKTKKSEEAEMASAPVEVSNNQEPAEGTEECSGKKESKFQTFKKFFKRKKRKESGALKNSASNEDLNKPPEQQQPEKRNGSEAGLGNRSQSHDSVFAADWSEAHEALGASQDSLHGKVKSLQMQLKQSLLCGKRTHDTGAVSEDDGLPCSPPDYTPSKTKPQRDSSISLDSGELSCPGSSRAMSPLVATPGDFSSPASASVCLDNSAARHKLELRQRGKRRKKRPVQPELGPGPDSLLEDSLNISTAEEPQGPEENEETEDVNQNPCISMTNVGHCHGNTIVNRDKDLKPENVQVMTELNIPEDSEKRDERKERSMEERDEQKDREDEERKSDGKEEEESEEEGTAEPCVPSLDQNLDQGQDQEEDQEDPEERDRASSATEPSAVEREYLLDPSGFNYGSENKLHLSDSSLEEKLREDLSDGEEEQKTEEEEREEEEQEERELNLTEEEEESEKEEQEEEESSLLQEVLSSLKTPLSTLDVMHMDHHHRETEEHETLHDETANEEEEEEKEEVQELLARPHTAEDIQEGHKQEVESGEQEVGLFLYKDAEDELKSAEEYLEEELQVEHFMPIELVSEIETKDIQEIKHGVALPLSQSDSEEEEEERRKDLNLIKQQETEENQEDLNAILDQIEQEVIESEEEVTDTAILDQVDKESNDVKETNAEMDKHIETEVELETQNSARFVEIVSEDVLEFDGEILQGKIASTEIADDQNHLEETEIPIIESEQVNIKQNDEKEAEMIDKYETEESENKEATISKIAVSKTTSLEINLVSPNSKKEFSFPNLEHFKGEAKEEICDKTEKSTVSTVEIMDTQYQEDLNQFEADVEILDKIDKTKEDEIIKGSIGENEMIEELENPEKIKEDVENFDNFDQMEEESTNLSMSKMEEIQELGQIEHKTEISQKIHEDADIFYKIDKMQKEKRVQFCMEEMEERDEQEKNEQKVKNSKNEESNWPKFTIATAWQRSLSTAEKEELGSPTHPEPGNQKDPTRPDPGSKVQESRSSPWSKQVQESRLETGSKPVQESRRESESPPVQLSKSEPKTQQDPESRPDPRSEQVQEARTESKTQQEPESRPDPGFKFQMSRPSPWSKQVQESRPNPGSEQIQKSKSDPKTQQDPESTEPDSKLQESRPGSWVKQVRESTPETRSETIRESRPKLETQQHPESRPEPEEVERGGAETCPMGVKHPGIHVDKLTEECPAVSEEISKNPFGVRLRRTQALHRFIAEDQHKQSVHELPSPSNKVDLLPSTNQPISIKPMVIDQPIIVKHAVLSQPITNKSPPSNPPIPVKPMVPRKPEVESGSKTKQVSDTGGGSDAPSWISMAKQKQKIYKENVKEEIEKESGKVISLDLKPASPMCPPTPVPPVPQKPSHFSCPTPAPVSPASALSSKTIPQKPSHFSCPAPAPVSHASLVSALSTKSVSQKPSHPCPAPAPAPVSLPPSSSLTSASSRPPSAHSPPPRVSSPQDEPPWMALAKKKAKAWSEMPQIVQS